jgi:hypothetical protein
VAKSQGMLAASKSWKRQGTHSSLDPPEGTGYALILILVL